MHFSFVGECRSPFEDSAFVSLCDFGTEGWGGGGGGQHYILLIVSGKDHEIVGLSYLIYISFLRN